MVLKAGRGLTLIYADNAEEIKSLRVYLRSSALSASLIEY
jgi:hypothetical protein